MSTLKVQAKAFRSGQYATGTQLLAIGVSSTGVFEGNKIYTVEEDAHGQYLKTGPLRQRSSLTTFVKAIEVPADSEFAVKRETLSNQVGGNHYGEGTDVFDYSLERNHDCLQHSAIKYIDRHKLKNGKEDILKAISVLERIIQEQYS